MQWLESEKASGLTRGRVLVPGCGFGHDVRAWVEAGFEAHGLDIAPSAVTGARAQTPAELSNASFVEGDFLNDDPEEPYDFLFEHTCFCTSTHPERCLCCGGGALVETWWPPLCTTCYHRMRMDLRLVPTEKRSLAFWPRI